MIPFDRIPKEVNLEDDECCVIFDLGCYFPYKNSEILTFEFSLGMEEMSDCKINHRYPNRGYQTISKKQGRRVSKVGYPYVMKLNEQGPMLFCLKVGIKEQYITIVLPIQTNMTKENPISVFSLHYMFDDSRFYITSYEKMERGWNWHKWYSHEVKNIGEKDIVLNIPKRIDDSMTVVYEDLITLYSMPIDLR